MIRSRQNHHYRWALLLLFILTATPLLAFEYKVADEVYLSGDFSEDVMLAGGTVNFDGTIWGDLLVGARTMTFDGLVDGNVNVGAQRVTINGEICRSLRAAGQSINLNSRIDGDATAFGQEITVTSDAWVGRDVAFFGTEVFINGDIGSDAYIYAATVNISGRIEGNLKVKAGKISIAPTAFVGGGFEYESREKAKVAPEAQVMGETRWKKSAKDGESGGVMSWVPPPVSISWSLFYFFGSAIIGVILILGRRESVINVANEIRTNGALAGALGLAIVILGLVIIFLMMITVVGIPAALAALTAYGLLFFVSKVFVAITVGMLLLGLIRRNGRVSLGWSLVIGLLLLSLSFKIPILGWLIYILAWAVGAGAVTLLFFRRKKPAVVEANANAVS